MMLPQFFDSPFVIRLSFDQIIERLEKLSTEGEGLYGVDIDGILKEVARHPELRNGITDISQIKDNERLISRLLAELFPAALTHNEIKAVAVPYQGLIFNYSERFRKILSDAGPGFEINIRDFDAHEFYIFCCCIILNEFYDMKVDFSKPLFYDIPTAEGIIKHYRISFNGDFMEVIPTENSIALSAGEIRSLLDNFDDLALWKEKFPPHSWIMKGFAIMTLFDVTVQNAVSIFKDNLLGKFSAPDLQRSLESIFESIFQKKGIRVGFTSYDEQSGHLSTPVSKKIKSFLLLGKQDIHEKEIMCEGSYDAVIKRKTYFTISDTAIFLASNPNSLLAQNFTRQGIRSFILAPLVKNNSLLGVMEVVSYKTGDFNSVNANKLGVVMPYLVDAIERKINDMQNQVQAVIQSNYTTLHPSVYWKFRTEAEKYIGNSEIGLDYQFRQITFKKVYPFYGQVDIQNSSLTRNLSVENDLALQVERLFLLLEQLEGEHHATIPEEKLASLKEFANNLSSGIRADTEQSFQHYLETEIYSLFDQFNGTERIAIEEYFKHTDSGEGDFYINRRRYEQTIMLVNNKLAEILDKRQEAIQGFYPHYYERFKTDGVEHNLYIGNAIAPEKPFDALSLKRLRLWQLLVMAEMDMEQHRLKSILPYHLGVTTLLLVFSSPINIRFRMDEKHFDIDGTYSVRYEVLKKRIDKAHLKNTQERITKAGAITIVYTKTDDAKEYYDYLRMLQSAGILEDTVEEFEVEELQGVLGLKALRVGVKYEGDALLRFDTIYDELYQQLH
jgi:hypothetical protein